MYFHCPSALPADRHLTTKDLKILMELLSGVSHNWYMLGIQLDIDTGVLSRFEEFNRDVAQYMKQMLKLLMKVDPPITVGQLLEALRSPIVGENALAGKLEKSYGTRGLCCSHACLCKQYIYLDSTPQL